LITGSVPAAAGGGLLIAAALAEPGVLNASPAIAVPLRPSARTFKCVGLVNRKR
jgi:hypothetical protein